MKETDELEPQQYQKLYQEESIPVKDVRKSTLRKFVYISSFICVLFIIIGLFVKFSDVVELPFIIKSDQQEETYRFPTPVYVIDKYVKSGDSVHKGQALIKITSPEIATMIGNYREAEQRLLNFEGQKTSSVEKQKDIISITIDQNKNTLHEIQNQITSLENTWKSNNTRLQYEYDHAMKLYKANKTLFDNNVISKFEFLEVEKNKMIAEDSLTSAAQHYQKERNLLTSLLNNYQLNNHTSQAELSKLSFDTKYDLVSLSNQFELAKDKIKNIFGDFEIKEGAIVLKANENGTISYVFGGEKEVLSGSILVKIIYNQSPMYAAISCPPSMIGKIAKNQQTALKIASFPFYEWGTVKGHVDNLSLTPDEKGFFSIKISIDNFGKLNHLTQVGMDGNASILLEEKTFYDYFFRRIKRIYYKATMAN